MVAILNGAILEAFAGPFFLYAHLVLRLLTYTYKNKHQNFVPRSCRVNQKFGSWIPGYFTVAGQSTFKVGYKHSAVQCLGSERFILLTAAMKSKMLASYTK